MNGSCLCGEIRYRLSGEGLGINYCHCTQCRKASGTAFATNMGVPRRNFHLLSGESSLGSFESSPGKRRYFCSRCGSPIYSHADQSADTVYVRLGTVDGDPGVTPDVHIHVSSKAPWYEILDELPQKREEEGLDF